MVDELSEIIDLLRTREWWKNFTPTDEQRRDMEHNLKIMVENDSDSESESYSDDDYCGDDEEAKDDGIQTISRMDLERLLALHSPSQE